MSVSQLIEAVAARREAFTQEQARVARERQRHKKAAAELETQRERNGREMAGYLLPDLDDEDLVALEARLRYPVFIQAKRETEAELVALDADRRALEADPRFRDRELLRVDYESQLAEIAEAVASFKAERAVWEGSSYFTALRERGWFEADYRGGLLGWLRTWRACSFLMEELEQAFPDREFPDDADVKQAWNTLFQESEPVLNLERDLEEKLAEIARLEARHAELIAAPETLFQALYQRLSGLIIDHLRAAPEELLVDLGRDDRVLATFLKKDVGLKKQAAYLDQLVTVRLDPYIEQLEAEVAKLGRKLRKYQYKRSRGKYVRAGPAEIEPFRRLPRAKWDKRRAKFAKVRERVVDFDKWDRGHFVDDFLWWDLVTRGARADDLYEVRVFHERHPGWSLDHFDDPLDRDHDPVPDAHDLAAAATAAAMLSDDREPFDPS